MKLKAQGCKAARGGATPEAGGARKENAGKAGVWAWPLRNQAKSQPRAAPAGEARRRGTPVASSAAPGHQAPGHRSTRSPGSAGSAACGSTGTAEALAEGLRRRGSPSGRSSAMRAPAAEEGPEAPGAGQAGSGARARRGQSRRPGPRPSRGARRQGEHWPPPPRLRARAPGPGAGGRARLAPPAARAARSPARAAGPRPWSSPRALQRAPAQLWRRSRPRPPARAGPAPAAGGGRHQCSAARRPCASSPPAESSAGALRAWQGAAHAAVLRRLRGPGARLWRRAGAPPASGAWRGLQACRCR
mmetsp:Transcript_117611/g.379612  ORF Transcript_117611/g.379612 Transcript_117611/m.379612 type:complete len:303 (-) Transcript_117611:947-1855(-)